MANAETPAHNEMRVRYELGMRVLEVSDRVKGLALARIGLNASVLMPGIQSEFVFSQDLSGRRLSILESDLLTIGSKPIRKITTRVDRDAFPKTQYYTQDGQTWETYGAPAADKWVSIDLPANELIHTLDELDIAETGNCYVEVNFSAFKPHDFQPSET